MITKQDLLEAIAECQGTRSPNANTAIKLAAFYTILDHMEESGKVEVEAVNKNRNSFAGYSLSDSDISTIRYGGTSEFAQVIDGKRQEDVWPVMDELMTIIKSMNGRLYSGVIRKLQ